MTDRKEVQLPTLAATRSFASKLAEVLTPPMTVALVGELGTGKTQLVRFVAQALGVHPEEVTSPTYVLLQRYGSEQPIYHFDFYRLESVHQVWDLGIDELYEQPLLIFIEWADKFLQCLPDDYLWIEISQIERVEADSALKDSDQRKVLLRANGPRSRKLLQSFIP